MISAVASGTSCHMPGNPVSGSETTTRSSSPIDCRRGLPGCSARSVAASTELYSERMLPLPSLE